MFRKIILAIGVLFLTIGFSQDAAIQTVLPDGLEWQPNPDIAGVYNAPGFGDPTQSGLYVMFGKMEQGVQFPPHAHPDDRITTVISGTMYYATGETFDETSVQAYPAGSVVYTPAGVSHYMWSKDGETVMQETGYGPTELTLSTNP
jgi:quercetin dioxygenase-like cupin family protein